MTQQQGPSGGKDSRRGIVTPPTVPVTEPTSPIMLGGKGMGGGVRGKDSLTERVRQVICACVYLIKPCIQIFVAVVCMCAVFIYATESEGFKFMDVSIIPLPFGEIRGRITGEHQEYLNIPYALPPQRFAVPQPWKGNYPDGFLDATVPPTPCAQIVGNQVHGAEDCLKLNIFAPLPSSSFWADDGEKVAHHHRRALRRLAGKGEGAGQGGGQEEFAVVPPRPVMVYFHSGDFAAGSADELDGGRLAARNDVIVVSVAYRLGALGFLAHPDMLTAEEGKEASRGVGNLGLLDQRAALLWIQEHIAAFNGDPTRVTVFGRGAGATAACLQAILPAGEGDDTTVRRVAQAAIAESGACDAQPLDLALAHGQEFAAAANCTTLACLEALPLHDLLQASGDVSAARFRFWQPVVDGHIVPLPAAQLLARAPQDLALIAGAGADEGQSLARLAFLRPPHDSDADYVAYVKGPMRRQLGLEMLTDGGVEELLRLYPPAGAAAAAEGAAAAKAEESTTVRKGGEGAAAAAAQPLTGNRLRLAQLLSDAHYHCPTLAAARALPNQANAYLYHARSDLFAQPCESAPPTPTSKHSAPKPAGFDTLLRAAEVPFVLREGAGGDCHRSINEAEARLAEETEKYWTNMARSTATPNAEDAHPALPATAPKHAGGGASSGESSLLPAAADHGVHDGHTHRLLRAAAHHGAGRHDIMDAKRREEDKDEEGAQQARWPALGEKGEWLVFEDNGVTTGAPDRLAFCAFWDRTKVYT